MARRWVLVTGANKGIGLAIVRRLLEVAEDTYVLLGSRDAERGQLAVESLDQDVRNRVWVLSLDVASQRSIDEAARNAHAIISENDKDDHGIYAVINNAGLGMASSLGLLLDVNVRAIRRVTEAFLPMLKHCKFQPAIVLNITSAAGPIFIARSIDDTEDDEELYADIEVLLGEDDSSYASIEAVMKKMESKHASGNVGFALNNGDWDAYGFSKACANALTRVMARQHTMLLINSVTPGFILTDMTRLLGDPEAMGAKPVESGAVAPVQLLHLDMTDEERASQPSGWYFGSDGMRSPIDRYRSPGDPEYISDDDGEVNDE